jgi:BirA family transcriptional regulator, biotin operon repressor / biotin---[acetyl-CoA-carboxylase] ligase
VLSDTLPDEFRRALQDTSGRRGRVGESVVFFAETGSTNDVAAQLAQDGAPEGTLVVALSQTAGRGRLGREWFSPPGAGLYVSVIWRDARVLPLVSLCGGVAVADGIRRSTGLPVVLKWPNDVVVPDALAPAGRRKVAGVLAEGAGGASRLQHVVLGCGINLRNATYPPSLSGRATSLEGELGRPVDDARVMAETLVALHEHTAAVARGDRARMLDRWRALAPSVIGSAVEWSIGETTRRGTTTGIDGDGALLVRTPDGQERLVAGEVRWLDSGCR